MRGKGGFISTGKGYHTAYRRGEQVRDRVEAHHTREPRPRHLREVVLEQHVRIHPSRVGPHRDGLGVRLGLRRDPHAAATYALAAADRLDLYIHTRGRLEGWGGEGSRVERD